MQPQEVSIHLLRKNIGEDTMYIVFDFKQTFLSKGFREGGDAYYDKKGILWFGVAAFVKQQHLSTSTQVLMCFDQVSGENSETGQSDVQNDGEGYHE